MTMQKKKKRFVKPKEKVPVTWKQDFLADWAVTLPLLREKWSKVKGKRWFTFKRKFKAKLYNAYRFNSSSKPKI